MAADLDLIYSYRGLIYALMSFFFFYLLNGFIYKYSALLTTQYIQQQEEHNPFLIYKWRNIMVSIIHSAISGVMAFICVILAPQIYQNVITTFYEPAYILVCISTGYFFYDMFDLINHHHYKGAKETIFHHLVAITSCCFVIWTMNYVGYLTTGFPIEINSVTLHFRQLVKLDSGSKPMPLSKQPLYKVAKTVNLVSFVVFRFGITVWLTYAIIRDRGLAPALLVYLYMLFALGVLIVLDFILFYRIVSSDYINVNKEKSTETDRERIMPEDPSLAEKSRPKVNQ